MTAKQHQISEQPDIKSLLLPGKHMTSIPANAIDHSLLATVATKNILLIIRSCPQGRCKQIIHFFISTNEAV
jgi:hypothetical protein